MNTNEEKPNDKADEDERNTPGEQLKKLIEENPVKLPDDWKFDREEANKR